MKFFYFLLIMVCTLHISKAQITFTQSDFPSSGTSIDYFLGSFTDSFNLGSPGSAQNFDFSRGLSTALYDTSNFAMMLPASTGFGSMHPNSNIAYLEGIETDSATGQTVVEFWQFLQVDANGTQYNGMTINVDTGSLFSGSAPTQMIPVHFDYSAPVEHIRSSWVHGYSGIQNYSWKASIGSFSHDEVVTTYREIDAWGTLKNPWGEYDALRIKISQIIIGTDSLNGQQMDSFTDSLYAYEYWIKGLGHYAVKVYTNPSFGQINEYEIADTRMLAALENITFTGDILVYPNPARNRLLYEFNAEKWTNYQVIDLQGKVLKKGIHFVGEEPWIINVSDLQKGTYILKLVNENMIENSLRFLVE